MDNEKILIRNGFVQCFDGDWHNLKNINRIFIRYYKFEEAEYCICSDSFNEEGGEYCVCADTYDNCLKDQIQLSCFFSTLDEAEKSLNIAFYSTSDNSNYVA